MKFNKEALYARLKEKTTWVGLAIALVSFLGLAPGSEEQIAGLLTSIVAMLLPDVETK